MYNETTIQDEPKFKLSDIFRTMREGILILGDNMRVSASNTAASEALSARGSDLRNKRLSEILRDYSLHDAFDRAIRQGTSSEVRVEMIDEDRVYDVLVSPLGLGKEYAAIGVFYEITRIEKLERVRYEFLSNISHELRTPLTSILAFVETLTDGAIDDGENNRRFLEVIRKNAERMNLLVDDISELTSIEEGTVSVTRSVVDLYSLVDQILTNLSTVAIERDVKLVNDVPEGSTMFADPVRLEQMLTNLFDNAIKFNRRSGTVTVEFEKDRTKDVVVVKDTGEGISKEHEQRIFERFYRVDKARSREVGGTGLGLAIVKHLARLHEGEVSVRSVVGKGSAFMISLPRPA